MADTKITGLQTPQVTTNPATDVLPIVNIADNSMAASGSTRKITVNQLLGAGGTATLASATISGDLTVDTSTLKVDSANNRVGIVQATPLYPLDVTGTVNGTAVAARLAYGVGGSVYSAFRFENTSFSGGNSEIRNYVNGATGTGSDLAFFTTQTGGSTLTERYRLDVSGVATWSNVGGVAGTAMTLNANGLGVGASPNISASGKALTISGAFTRSRLELQNTDGGTAGVTCGTISWFNGSNAIADITGATNSGSATLGSLAFSTGGSPRLTIDSSGNVGIGGSPSTKLHVVGGNARINDGFQLEFGGTTNSIAGSNANNTMNIYTNNVLRVSAKANGQVRFIPLAADPAGAEAGDVYYNSTSNKLKCYNGTTWNDLF
jgi:hypothetical protein